MSGDVVETQRNSAFYTIDINTISASLHCWIGENQLLMSLLLYSVTAGKEHIVHGGTRSC